MPVSGISNDSRRQGTELVRIAEQRRVAVEIVKNSDALTSIDGIGSLLRPSGPASYLYGVALTD